MNDITDKEIDKEAMNEVIVVEGNLSETLKQETNLSEYVFDKTSLNG